MTAMINRQQFFIENVDLVTNPQTIVYCIRHVPTKACWIGTATNPIAAWDSWFYRLRSVHAHPPLNWAIRAVYTMRSDFEFVVLEKFLPDQPLADCEQRLGVWMAKNRGRGRQFNLNIGKSATEKAYWVNRSGEPWRFTSQTTHAPKKRKLVPGKVKEAAMREPTQYQEAQEAPALDPLKEINELRAAQGKPPLPKLEGT